MPNLYEDMVEYVKLTDELLSERPARQPAFSKTAAERAVDAMAQANLIHGSERDAMARLFNDNPDKALESLEKVASCLIPKAAAEHTLGGPSEIQVGRQASESARKGSDQALFSGLGLL